MKKVFFVLVVILACTATLPATTNMLNLGYSVGPYLDWPTDTVVTRDLTLNWIRLGSDNSGFYSQLSPYLGLSGKDKSSDSTWKYSDYDWFAAGVETILGWGGDFSFGQMGVIVGGGGYADLQYMSLASDYITISAGLGLGANLYYQPGNGDFLINAGMSLAWSPYYNIQDLDNSSYGYSDIESSRFDVTFNVGVGFRTGGDTPSSRDTDHSSGGGDDDW